MIVGTCNISDCYDDMSLLTIRYDNEVVLDIRMNEGKLDIISKNPTIATKKIFKMLQTYIDSYIESKTIGRI